MTQVYNYFALPPAQREFCNVATRIAGESLLVAPADLETFAARSLQSLEAVFEDFHRAYEQYRVSVAMWDASYGTPQVVNPASYTGAAYYTPADQGFGPEPRGEPVFISEPVVESSGNALLAGPAEYSVVETGPMIETGPAFETSTGIGTESVTDPDPIIAAQPFALQSEAGEPASGPVFVSNPVVEAVPDDDG